jgi:hypothetical protein
MREPTQRFWDAMIIKSWQNFDSCYKLNIWAREEFGKYPQHLELKRTQNCFGSGTQGVRVWVAQYMPALSEQLFALPKERHIELLQRARLILCLPKVQKSASITMQPEVQ